MGSNKKCFLSAALILVLALAWLMAPSPKRNGRGEATEPKAAAAFTQQPPPPSRSVESPATAKEDFFAVSRGEWMVKRSPAGFVESIRGGSYRQPAARSESLASDFLTLWAKPLFGVEARALHPIAKRGIGNSQQYTYEQVLHGLRVIGSGVNLHFDRGGSLVYAAASTYSGEIPRNLPKYSQAEAVGPLRDVLSGYLAERGLDPKASHSMAREEGMILSYRLVRGSISLVYRAEIPLEAPLYGTLEALVDAQTNSIVVFRPMAKN